MWPMEARTSKPLPRYFSIVFAFAGDSTITNDLPVAIPEPIPSLLPDASSQSAMNLAEIQIFLTRFGSHSRLYLQALCRADVCRQK
jgi:hypothetical protein